MDINMQHSLNKNTKSFLAKILEAKKHETKAARPLTSHLTKYQNKTNKTGRTLLETQGQTYK